jgi:hypothetical protein
MKKVFSKKYWLTCISALAVGTGIILACAGGDWDDYGNSNFTPEAFADSSYRPFFYSEWLYYYNIGHDTQHDTRFNETIVNEWSDFFRNSIPRSELEYLLLNSTSVSVDSALGYITGKITLLPPAMQPFQLFKNKNNPAVQAFITYLSLAQQCEAFAVNNMEYQWDYESKKNKTSSVNAGKINTRLLQGFNETKDPFLKERYWFQLVRSYFFNEPSQKAIDFFENNEKQFPKNDMYYRAMAYSAGAYYKLKNYSKANYYYSKVYDGCAALKTVAHFSFHPQEEADWKATLTLCANNDEKATLWQMLGIFYADANRAIQEIYALNPRSEKLDLLLTRAINMQEQKFSMRDDVYPVNSLQPVRDTVNSELLTLVTRIAQASSTHKPYMWQIAAGYLQMLNGNNDKAGNWYAMAEKNLPNEQLLQWQLRLLKLMNKVAGVNRIDSQFENSILADINWLQSPGYAGTFRYTAAFVWIKRKIAALYMKQKEYIKAVCFNNYSAFYVNNNQVEAMKSFLNKKNKSPYEQLCNRLYTITIDDLTEYQAIRLAFDDKLEESIAKMQSGSTELPGNPFNGRLQDCHDCDHTAPQKIKYTKLSLLEKMKDMSDKIKAGSDVYRNALLLATAHYNITHYGNARAFYECKVLGGSHYSPFSIDSVFRGFLTDMKMATKYYNIALKAAKTNEEKAKCHFMLAKCERNEWYNQTLYNKYSNEYSSEPGPDFLPWNGFKSLQQYSNTQFYKEAIKECGYFRSYLKK